MTKKIGLLLMIHLLCVSCASSIKEKQKKLSRFNRVSDQGGNSNSGMPNFILPDWQEIQKLMKTTKRSPASQQDESAIKEMSSKRLYFLSLLQQYYQLKKLTGSEDAIRSCPVFHHDILTQIEQNQLIKDKGTESVLLAAPQSIAISKWHLFPEYHLAKEDGPYISENSSIEDPLRQWREYIIDHQVKVENELQELCEYGQSDNYYIYVNYLRYLSQHKNFENTPSAFKSALKIPVVANIYLLAPIFGADSGRIKLGLYDKEVLSRLRVGWIRDVLYNIARHRYSERRNRIVLRENK